MLSSALTLSDVSSPLEKAAFPAVNDVHRGGGQLDKARAACAPHGLLKVPDLIFPPALLLSDLFLLSVFLSHLQRPVPDLPGDPSI